MADGNMEELSFSDGQAIIVQGEQASAVYFVAEGAVKVLTRDDNDNQVVLARLQRGEIPDGRCAIFRNGGCRW